MSALPKGLVLDWGGVLCVDPAPGFVRYCASHLGVEGRQLASAIHAHMDFFQKGGREEGFWDRVCADCGVPAPGRPLWGEALAAVYEPLTDVHAYARLCRSKGVKVALLTNTEAPSRDFHLTLGYDFFDARVFSCDEGLAKPEAAIYELAASRLGLDPSECLMVDDKAVNVEGARKAGMHAHLFFDLAGLRAGFAF